MKHLKLFFALFAMLALGVGNAWGAEETESYTCAKGTIVSDLMTWTLTSCTIEHEKAESSNALAVYAPWRIYAKQTITITPKSGITITKMVITSTSDAYATAGTKTWTNATATSSSTSITVIPTDGTSKFVYTNTNTGQTRWQSVVITYTSDGTEPPTPPTTYDVTWMVNGEEWDTTEDVEENTQITTLPTEPTDECAGKVFQGWTNKEITDGQKPTVLFKDKSPKIKDGLTTFYAVFATVPAGGGTGGSITISSETTNFPTSYGTANTFTEYTLEDYKFKIQQVYKTGAKLQWRASGNSNGTGTMYNTQKFPANIASIVIVFDASDNNKNHTVKVGAAQNPTSGTSITPSKSDATYTFDCSGGSYDYFVLTNGTGAGYVSSITINYGSVATPSDYTTSCGATSEPEDVYNVKIADDIEHGTITAAPATAKAGATITLTATAEENYSFGTWSVTEEGGTAVTVSNNQFTMPEANVTVSATFVENPKWTITWKSVEGSTTTEVYQGKSLGTTIADANNCPEGKVFMGWTVANEVNPNGLGIEYATAKDIPTDNTTYNAVYAKETIGSGEEGSAEVALASGVYDSTNKNITWTTDGYATILQAKGSSSSDVNEDYIASPRWYVGHNVTFTPQSGVNITKIVIDQGSDSKYQEFASATINNATITIDGQIITITPSDGTVAVTITPGKQLRPTAITIHKGPSTSYSHYSFDCEVVNDPYLNVDPTTITFDATNVGFNSTKTIDITAGYLTEDITLAISGENANEFSVSTEKITKAEEVSQEVTVTYAPTAEGNHTATLTITSGTLSKTVALSGSAEVAKIYTQTPLAEITKYDEVLIVGTNNSGSFAMANNDATNTGPKAVKVTIKDNTIATTATNIQWQIGNTDGVLVFSPKDTETWLYCNSSNNGLRIGSDTESMTFEIKDDYIYNTYRKRYVGIYNSEDWRSYEVTTGNIKDQTFAFYIIKGEIPDNVYTITYETNGGNTISPATDATTIPNVLPTPTKAGMNFAGWYIDQELTTPATPGADLTGNTTLYAKWVEPYTVAEARTLIATDTENKGITAYVQGIVTAIEEINTTYGNATYTIGDTEDAVETLKIYRGHYLNNETFTDEDQLKVKDQVVIYGTLINHNTGGYQFNQGNYIYKLTSATGKETTTLSWSATTCKVQIGATNTFPTLTKSHDDITIKYTSSNTSVATIANDGSITLVAAGTTTITAAIEEDATYAASSASYELTVVEVVPTGIFQLYSGELVEGEYVLVDGAKDKALKAAVAGNTRLAGEDVTIADDAILNPDASIVWNVAKSGTDWTIYNEYEEKYVAGGTASAAQLLADGSDEKALWTVTGIETYDIVNKVNEEGGVNSHLRWGGAYWACYGANTGKTLRLYKKIDVPTPTISLASGTYIGTQTATVSCALATATMYYTTSGETPSISSSTIAVGGSISITESCTLKVIAVANTKESSIVETTYKIIPDGGIWVLVDDATSLQAGDLVVIASKENNAIAGKIEEGKDYMTSVNDAEFSSNNVFITKLPENAMTLTLGGSAGAWTLEYQQLYLNASGANNSLGADATTTWNITIDESANATIAYDVYAIRYNKSNPRFKSYNSTNGIVLPQIYKYTTDFYTRDVTNKYGTICLPYGSTNYAGATFYEVAGKDEGKVYLASVDALEAGVPYIFEKTANQIKVVYTGEAVDAPQNGDANGLVGTFVETTVPDGMYILYQGAFCTNEPAGTLNKIKENRAYLNMANVEGDAPQQMPGRRYIGMSVQGENEATGFENITAPEGQTIKAIVNGQLIIIRDGEKFNAQGQKL